MIAAVFIGIFSAIQLGIDKIMAPNPNQIG
jgi:hypothetical protein